VTFHGTRDFADVIKVMILRWRDYPWLSGWSQSHYKGLCKGKREARRIREEALSTDTENSDALLALTTEEVAGSKGIWARPLEAGKGKQMDSPIEPPEGTQPC